jgi:hypothetical protein
MAVDEEGNNDARVIIPRASSFPHSPHQRASAQSQPSSRQSREQHVWHKPALRTSCPRSRKLELPSSRFLPTPCRLISRVRSKSPSPLHRPPSLRHSPLHSSSFVLIRWKLRCEIVPYMSLPSFFPPFLTDTLPCAMMFLKRKCQFKSPAHRSSAAADSLNLPLPAFDKETRT